MKSVTKYIAGSEVVVREQVIEEVNNDDEVI
jgi:hypothetical protein